MATMTMMIIRMIMIVVMCMTMEMWTIVTVMMTMVYTKLAFCVAVSPVIAGPTLVLPWSAV